MPGPLDRLRQRPLVLGAGAGLAARLYSAAVRQEAPQEAEVFVVDERHLFDAHDAGATAAAAGAAAASRVAFVASLSLPGGAPLLASFRGQHSPRGRHFRHRLRLLARCLRRFDCRLRRFGFSLRLFDRRLRLYLLLHPHLTRTGSLPLRRAPAAPSPRALPATARRRAYRGTAPGRRRPPCDSASDRQGYPRNGCAGALRHTPGGPSAETDCIAPPACARPPR